MEEVWKLCTLHSNYEISNLGNVRNNSTGKTLKPNLKTRYLKIDLGRKRTTNIHRLVLLAFKPDEFFEGAQVNHIDGNKHNNNLDNLEWCTGQYNLNHAVKTGLNPNFVQRGEEHKFSKLIESDIPKIRKLYEEIKNYTKVGKEFGVSDNTIKKIITSKIWTHI